MRNYSYGKHSINENDIQAVVKTLNSGWLTQGPTVEKFEQALCKLFGAKYAIAVSNGTASLHLAGLALGWKEGDVIITSPLTFLASANCILYCGATPDFVDIDPVTYTISPNLLEEKILSYKKEGKKVRAVVAVDFAGHPCDWAKLVELSTTYGFDLIDDACHALGAKYESEHICSAKFAKAVNLSFHPVKSITTGEGGAILTNDETLAKKIRILRSHGMTKDPSVMEKIDGPWYYEMHQLGFNYRITDFQCALGESQLARLGEFNSRRREIAEFYNKNLDGHFLKKPGCATNVEHVYHLYPILLKLENLKVGRKEIFESLWEQGIRLQVHYYPVHLQPYYKTSFGFAKNDFPVSEDFYDRELSLPIYPDLTDQDLPYLCDVINKTLKSFSK